MPKNALFLGKSWKNRQNIGGSDPQPPLASGAPDPQVVTSTQFTYDFWALLKLLAIVKITT